MILDRNFWRRAILSTVLYVMVAPIGYWVGISTLFSTPLTLWKFGLSAVGILLPISLHLFQLYSFFAGYFPHEKVRALGVSGLLLIADLVFGFLCFAALWSKWLGYW